MSLKRGMGYVDLGQSYKNDKAYASFVDYIADEQ